MTDDFLCAGTNGIKLLTHGFELGIIGGHALRFSYLLDSVLREEENGITTNLKLYGLCSVDSPV